MSSFDLTGLDLNGRSIMVTGGTGSFGKAFVEMVITNYNPSRVVILSRDEMKHYEMEAAWSSHPDREKIRFFIGDVRDRSRLEMAMRGVDTVIHAAALKHVPTAEYNPFECIHTNVYGAENVAHSAIRSGVRQVIALSTDKATNPINLYGASKLASDKIFVAANNLSAIDGPRFSVVRYGNVLGSRGSVVPLFRRLLREKAEFIPITDERMTRFWISLRQGVEFVLSSLRDMEGGEIYIPKIPSMTIVDLARYIAPDIPHKVIGMRPGEKLHEVMVTADEARTTIDVGDRYIIEPTIVRWSRQRDEAIGKQARGKPVPADFVYSSDRNADWLTQGDLGRLLDDLAEEGAGGLSQITTR